MRINAEIVGVIITGIFGLVVVYYTFYLKEKMEEEEDYYELTNHALFSRMDYILSGVDYSLEFEDKGRNKLINDVIKMYFYTVKKELYKLAEDIGKHSREDIDFNVYDMHMKTLNNIIEKYTDVSNYNTGKLDDDSRETLNIFLDKFQEWHCEKINFLRERSAEISNSSFYKKDIIKLSVLFDVYVGIMASTLQDGSKTLQELDGELDGRRYKKFVIGKEKNEK